MEPWFGSIQRYGNFTEGKLGCSQFVVHRDRIRSLPKKFYLNMYMWLVENTLDEAPVAYHPITKGRLRRPTDTDPKSNFYTSRYMEWSWELIFTSFKPDEIIDQPVGSSLISALYGALAYYRDVTSIVLQHFYRNNSFVIPVHVRFNDLFGDVVQDVVKELKISIDLVEYIIPEHRDKEITLPLTDETDLEESVLWMEKLI
jgi:hypothetical protein